MDLPDGYVWVNGDTVALDLGADPDDAGAEGRDPNRLVLQLGQPTSVLAANLYGPMDGEPSPAPAPTAAPAPGVISAPAEPQLAALQARNEALEAKVAQFEAEQQTRDTGQDTRVEGDEARIGALENTAPGTATTAPVGAPPVLVTTPDPNAPPAEGTQTQQEPLPPAAPSGEPPSAPGGGA